jgi:hypothetical protein
MAAEPRCVSGPLKHCNCEHRYYFEMGIWYGWSCLSFLSSRADLYQVQHRRLFVFPWISFFGRHILWDTFNLCHSQIDFCQFRSADHFFCIHTWSSEISLSLMLRGLCRQFIILLWKFHCYSIDLLLM